MAVGILDIEAHLQEQGLTGGQQVELLSFRDAAVQLIEGHPDLPSERKPLNLDDPLMRLAVLEVVRDMHQGTQAGGVVDDPSFGVAGEVPGFSRGRPALSPYVLGLLQPYLRSAATAGPVGCFPTASDWPAW